MPHQLCYPSRNPESAALKLLLADRLACINNLHRATHHHQNTRQKQDPGAP